MAATLELTEKRKKKLDKLAEKLRYFYHMVTEIRSSKKAFRLYAEGKKSISAGKAGLPAEEVLADLF